MVEEKCPKCGVRLKRITKGDSPLYLKNLYECPEHKTRYRITYKGDVIEIGGQT